MYFNHGKWLQINKLINQNTVGINYSLIYDEITKHFLYDFNGACYVLAKTQWSMAQQCKWK